MRSSTRKYLWLSFIVVVLLCTAGCTKEKAEAIKIAAEKFRIEAVAAIQKVNHLLLQSVSMPFEGVETQVQKIVSDLDKKGETIGAKELSFLIGETSIGGPQVEKINKEFERIETQYYEFEAMFRSLPEGSYFARNAVKRAERYSINLTVQMIHFAESLKNNPVQFTGRRTLIVERIKKAKEVQDEVARKGLLTEIAKDILQLTVDEETAKQEAIIQCLKAAESGKLISQLIRDYDALNVEQLLVAIGGTLGFIAEISGGNQDVAALLNKYKSVETEIRNDKYWSELLDKRML
jgi:hypothetical protein